MSDFLPVSVWYGENRARAPMMPTSTEESRRRAGRDFESISEQGFNAVRLWVDWASLEPEPGEYAVDRVDHLLDLAADHDLRAIFQLYVESAPSWVHRRYPEARYTAQNGDQIDPQASPGVTLDHPEVRERAGEMLRRVAGHVADHPAFHAWDLWSEPHIVQWTWLEWLPFDVAWFDYSPASRERFRDWLRERYDDVDDLNEQWYRTYGSFDEVTPPKYVTLSTYADLLDWQEYTLEKIADDLAWRRETVREVDAESVLSSHAAITSVFTLPLSWYGNPDDWRVADEVDVWGTSMYPKHTGDAMPLDPATRAAALDATRSASEANDADFWIGELQGGHGTTGMRFGEPVTPEDVALWGWTALSRGAKGLNYYAWYPMSCGYETSGFGLADADGSVTDRVRSAGDLAATVDREMDLFAAGRPVDADVGLVYSVETLKMLLASREPARDDGDPAMYRDALTGIYRVLFDENVPADFVHGSDLRAGDLPYDALYFPLPIMLSEATAASLREYVRDGGHLYASVRPAWNDVDGTLNDAIPGHGLADLFGCEERWIREVERPTATVTADHDVLGSLSVGDAVTGSAFQEALDVTDGTAVAEFDDGTPAVVTNEYGDGRATLAGSLFGKANDATGGEADGAAALLDGVREQAGVRAPVSVSGVGDDRTVEARLQTAAESRLLFAFDHDGASAPSFAVDLDGAHAARDLVADEPVPCDRRDGRVVVDPTGEDSLWIVELAPE
ncbi:beta-galactosidase [Halosimplex marinum]|uniref:beta-galactosidase n=1 Tax=Halosimplex marinum TaxID=3396620 RepID=UPI003F546F2F